MDEARVLCLEGVHNFRDYGGYPLSGGGRLKRGLLWRSGQHHDASDADLERIATLGLASVFDLRTVMERDKYPCRRPSGFSAEIHALDEGAAMPAPHVEAAGAPMAQDAAGAREMMRRAYQTLPVRPQQIQSMRRYLAELAEGKGASLVNCMAGKDRTGITVAMLHLAVGVHPHDIVEDYLLTNTAGDFEARISAGGRTMTMMTGELSEEVTRVLMGVEAEYLETSFATLREKYGSTDAFLTAELGLDDAMRGKLLDALAEG